MSVPMTWRELLDACDAVGVSQRQLAAKMQAAFPRAERPPGQKGLSLTSMLRYAEAGVAVDPRYAEWFLARSATVRGRKQEWAEFRARFGVGPEPEASQAEVTAPEPPVEPPSQPAAPEASAPPQAQVPRIVPQPRPNALSAAPRRKAALMAVGLVVVLSVVAIGAWSAAGAEWRRAVEDLRQCHNLAAGLARTVELLAARSGDLDQFARGDGVSSAAVTEALGGQPKRTIPDRPFSWQETNCNPDAGDVTLGGGCWVWSGKTAPCPAKTFEDPATGRCYRPVVKANGVPQSETPTWPPR